MRTLEDVLEEITPTPDPGLRGGHGAADAARLPSERKRRASAVDLTRFRPRPSRRSPPARCSRCWSPCPCTGDGGERRAPRPRGRSPGRAPRTFGERRRGRPAARATRPAAPGRRRSRIPPPGRRTATSPPARETARIERSAQLTLAADPDEFDGLADAVFRDRRPPQRLRPELVLHPGRGRTSAAASSSCACRRTSSQPALNDLSRLATVRCAQRVGHRRDRQRSSSVRDRLRTARALRTSLLRRLELATTDTAERALRRRLEIVGNRITGLRAQFRGIRERTEYATVSSTLVDKDAGAVAASETDEAVDDAVGSLEDILNFLIRAAGVLVPLARRRASWPGSSPPTCDGAHASAALA